MKVRIYRIEKPVYAHSAESRSKRPRAGKASATGEPDDRAIQELFAKVEAALAEADLFEAQQRYYGL